MTNNVEKAPLLTHDEILKAVGCVKGSTCSGWMRDEGAKACESQRDADMIWAKVYYSNREQERVRALVEKIDNLFTEETHAGYIILKKTKWQNILKEEGLE